MKIKGSSFLITGAGNGLGLETTKHLLELGANVYVIDWDNSNDSLETLQKQYSPQRLQIEEVDVTDQDSVVSAFDKAHSCFGSIQGVVNCAGVIVAGFLQTSQKAFLLTQDSFKLVMSVNVLGTFHTCQAYTKLFFKHKYTSGVIINVSSISGYDGGPSLVAYSASKGAILGMTLPLARELGKFGIRVVTIAPGFFPSKMGNMIQKKYSDAIKRNSCLGRFGVPKEFALLVEGIILNGYLTGVNLNLNGGTGVPML